jgi:demethoxyubiquinone hydroxylase (CLK1/Coq7/Cat5 family)
MKTEQEWKAHFEAHFKATKQSDDEMWRSMISQIQSDALWHAANNINAMSRGTKSEERAVAIDEACDLVSDIARNTGCVVETANNLIGRKVFLDIGY